MFANIAEHLQMASIADERQLRPLNERMKKPRPGDLVIDIFTAKWDPRRFGRLSRVEKAADKTMFVVAPLVMPGREFSWDSKVYEFIALPADIADGQWVPD
jgi:hypothetical protein